MNLPIDRDTNSPVDFVRKNPVAVGLTVFGLVATQSVFGLLAGALVGTLLQRFTYSSEKVEDKFLDAEFAFEDAAQDPNSPVNFEE